MVDASEISTKRALSPGWNRPNPSAMFLVDEAAESRIWSQNLKSFEAGPVSVSAYTSRFSSSAICHASRSSYRLTPDMKGTVSNRMPVERQTTNLERRTSNNEPRTQNDEPRTSNVERYGF